MTKNQTETNTIFLSFLFPFFSIFFSYACLCACMYVCVNVDNNPIPKQNTKKKQNFFKIYFEKISKMYTKTNPQFQKQTQHTNPTRTLITISRKRLPSIFRKRSDKLKRDLEDAVREPNSSFTHHRNSSGSSIHGGAGGDPYDDSDRDTLSGDHNVETGCDAEMYGSPNDQFHVGGMGYMKSANPTNIYMKFEAHETESHAVRWSPIERVIATGGADRKVKLWDVGKGKWRY